MGRSALYFPLVGFFLGLTLSAAIALLDPGYIDLKAALIVALWSYLTGGLHLDGLADTADAWVGGMGDRERTLKILKDPYSGPAAVSTLFLVLLIKYTAIKALLLTELPIWVFIVPPLIGRSFLLLTLLTTPYIRAKGMGQDHAQHLPRRSAQFILATIFIVVGWLLPIGNFLLLIVLLAGWGYKARQTIMQRLGGVTGDLLGATCEITELITLIALAWSMPFGFP